MRNFKTDLFGTDSVILHRREIVRREGVFAALDDPDKRRQFDAGLLLLLQNMPYRAATITIDKREHLEKYERWHFDPYHYCLRCLIERYVLWLERHNLTGDVVIEPRSQKADKKVKTSFNLIYNRGTEHIGATLVQKRLTSGEIKFYPKSRNVAAMQLCDLIAHPSYRYMKFEHFNMQQPQDYGSEIAAILVESRYARHPKTLAIKGWGTKWLPGG